MFNEVSMGHDSIDKADLEKYWAKKHPKMDRATVEKWVDATFKKGDVDGGSTIEFSEFKAKLYADFA